jgi:hypothetical protein
VLDGSLDGCAGVGGRRLGLAQMALAQIVRTSW